MFAFTNGKHQKKNTAYLVRAQKIHVLYTQFTVFYLDQTKIQKHSNIGFKL